MIKILKKSFLLMVLSALALSGVSVAEEITAPQGWRAAVKDEVDDGWRDFSPVRYLEATGDFNGDGVTDEARIFVRPDGSEAGLFAFICDRDRNCKKHLLLSVKGAKAIRRMGINREPRGQYKTACGKGYRECKEDETPEIEIRNDSIDLFENEGAYSYFYWDEESNGFKRVWISD